jgi:hypothetical protein
MTIYDEDEMAKLAEAVSRGDIRYDMDRAGQVELPPPAEGEAMVACSLRLPVGVYQRIKDVAAGKGLKPTVLMRDWIQEGLAGSEDDRAILLSDVLRALSRLPEQPPGMAQHQDAA